MSQNIKLKKNTGSPILTLILILGEQLLINP